MPGARIPRAGAVLLSTGLFAATAHGHAGSSGPSLAAVLVTLALISPVVWHLSATRFRVGTLLPVAAGGQLLAHAVFSLLGSGNPHGAHAATTAPAGAAVDAQPLLEGPHAVTAVTDDHSTLMLLAHVAAALLVTAVLCHGERLVLAAAGLIGTRPRTLAPIPAPLTRPVAATPSSAARTPALLLGSERHRGPPVPAAA